MREHEMERDIPWDPIGRRSTFLERVVGMVASSDVASEGWMGLSQRIQLASSILAVLPSPPCSNPTLPVSNPYPLDSAIVTNATRQLFRSMRDMMMTVQCALTYGGLGEEGGEGQQSSLTEKKKAEMVLQKVRHAIDRTESDYALCTKYLSHADTDPVLNPRRSIECHPASWYFREPHALHEAATANLSMSEVLVDLTADNRGAAILRMLRLLYDEMQDIPPPAVINHARAKLSHKTLELWRAPDLRFDDEPPSLFPALSPWHFQRCFFPFSSWFALHSQPPLLAHMQLASAFNGSYIVLGSGWGCCALYSSVVFNVQVTAYEPGLLYVAFSERFAKIFPAGTTEGSLCYRNIDPLEADLRQGKVIMMPLPYAPATPVSRARMYAKILTEMQVGTVIIDTTRTLAKPPFVEFFTCIQTSTIPMPYNLRETFSVFERKKAWVGGKHNRILSILKSVGVHALRQHTPLLPAAERELEEKKGVISMQEILARELVSDFSTD